MRFPPGARGNVRASGFRSEGPAICPGASCLRAWTDGSDQSLSPLCSPSLEGPARAGGTPQEGTSLLPGPASCPFPGSNWTAAPREKRHLGLPSTARRPGGGTEGRRPRSGGSRGPGRGGDQGPELWSREGGRKGRDGGEGAGREDQTQRGGGVASRREGEGPRRRDTWMRGEAARPRQEGGRAGGRGREAGKSDGQGEGGRQLAWRSPARVAQPCRPPGLPSPQWRCSCHTRALPRGQSCPGAAGNKWCPR